MADGMDSNSEAKNAESMDTRSAPGTKRPLAVDNPPAGNDDDDILLDVAAPPATKQRKKKKSSSAGSQIQKTAAQTLNELYPGLKYECISQSGPSHQPTFEMQLTVNDQVSCTALNLSADSH